MHNKRQYQEKYRSFQSHFGINIIEQSDKNMSALRKRLTSDNNAMLSPQEDIFFEFWMKRIAPLFTAKHGTTQLKKIQKAGVLSSVADRRILGTHKNSRTGGLARQGFNYFVLGIGEDHPIPLSVDSDVIRIDINHIPDTQLIVLEGAFIGGHLTDYQGSRQYPPIMLGNTKVWVDYNKKSQTRTTTFCRSDQTKTTEVLSFKDEIIAAIPNFQNILEFLGLKFIEYLRFIGDEFQQEILMSDNIDVVKSTFHALFPSYRFPELKIPASIPMAAPFVKCSKPSPDQYLNSYKLHEAVRNGELDTVTKLIEQDGIDIDSINGDGKSPLTSILSNRSIYKGGTVSWTQPEPIIENGKMVRCTEPEMIVKGVNFHEMVKYLLSKGATINTTDLEKSVKSADEELTALILSGSKNPTYPAIRDLPFVNVSVMMKVIDQKDLKIFEHYYQMYCERHQAETLLPIILSTISATKPDATHLEIFKQVLRDCDPNYRSKELTLLMEAALNGKTDALNILLECERVELDLTINTQGGKTHEYEGATALHLSAAKGHEECVRKLIVAGACVDVKDARNRTAHHLISRLLSGEDSYYSAREKDALRVQNLQLQMFFGHGIDRNTIPESAKKSLVAILKLLQEHGAATVYTQTTDLPEFRDFAVAGLVTATCNTQKYVLLMRKPTNFGDPKGRYMFPGGIKDPEDENYNTACIREILEETRVDVSNAHSTLLHTLSQTLSDTLIHREFYHYDLGDCVSLPTTYPASDAACVQWIAYDDLEFSQVAEQISCSYVGVPLRATNVTLLKSMFKNQKMDEAKINSTIISELAPTQIGEQLMKLLVMYHDSVEDNHEEIKTTKAHIEQSLQCGIIEADQLRIQGQPILFHTCTYGFEGLTSWLIKLGADVNITIYNHRFEMFTPLMLLISSKKYALAKQLIEYHNVDVDFCSGYMSALFVTLNQEEPDIEFFQFLIARLGEASADMIGSCLMVAIKNKDTRFASELLSYYSINLNRTFDAQTVLLTSRLFPLAAACQLGNPTMVQLLLQNGASPMVQPSATIKNIYNYAKHCYKRAKQDLDIANLKLRSDLSEATLSVFKTRNDGTPESLKQKVDDYDVILEMLAAHMPEKINKSAQNKTM